MNSSTEALLVLQAIIRQDVDMLSSEEVADLYSIAEQVAAYHVENKVALKSPEQARAHLLQLCRNREHEVFGMLLLDNQNRIIKRVELGCGTIDASAVYPREVIKACMLANAAAITLYHNHPSGSPEPSQADRNITNRLSAALAHIDIRIIDHIVFGECDSVSFAERGWI